MKKYLFYILLFIQPLLDVLTSFQLRYFNNSILSISAIIRLILLLIMVIYIIVKKDKKDYIVLGVLSIYSIISIIHFKDITSIMNISKIIYLPLSILFFIRYNERIDKNNIILLYTIYLLLVIVPTLLHINFDVYSGEEAKKASLGLFYGGNELSAFLLGYLPLILTYLKDIDLYKRLIVYVLIIAAFILIGTKTLFLGGVLVLIIYLIYYIKNEKIKNKKYLIGGIIGTLLLGIIILPYTPIYKNMKITLDYYGIHSIKDINIDTIDNVIYSKRLTYAKDLMNDYNNHDLTDKLIGVGRIDIKDSEIDIIDMLYIIGIIGLIIYIGLLVYLLLTNKLKNIYLLSFILFILMSCFSGHIFIKPNVLIYIGVLFNLNKHNIIKNR